MARVRLNETQDVAEDHRWMFERIEKRGPILNIFRALSHSPEAMRRFMRFGSYFLENGKLDPKLRELAILRAGLPLPGAVRVLAAHRVRAAGGAFGQPDPRRRRAEQRALRPEGDGGAGVRGRADERCGGLGRDVRGGGGFLNEEEVVELTMVTSFYNLVSRTLNALQVDIDAPAQKDYDELGVTL